MSKIDQLEKRIKDLERKLCCKTQFFDTVGDLPVEGNTGVIYVTDDGNIYIWNGVEYVTTPNPLPTAGTTGQVLAKVDGDDYNTEWVTPSGGGVTEITYADLSTAIGASELVPGSKYLITDFRTVHYFLNENTTMLDAVNTADVEPIIVTALSVNELEPVAYSTIHTDDILHYDWNPANWINDRSFSDVDSTGFGLGTIVSGWKGVIYYREDTYQKNITHYDFRGVKFRRWAVTASAYDAGTTYANGNTVINSGIIYKSVKDGNTGQSTSDTAWWLPCIDTNVSLYWAWNDSKINGISVNNADYKDVHTFNSSYDQLFYNNYLGPKSTYYDDPMIITILPNIVFIGQGDIWPEVGYQIINNKIDGGAYYGNSTIGNNFYSNTTGDNFNSNTIGNDFYYNTIGNNFYSNTIGNNFNYNTIGNDFNSNAIGNNFNYNTIGNNFYSNTTGNNFNSNTTGDNFYSNTIGNDFYYNTIGNNFYYNTIGDNFNYNTIGNDFNSNAIGNNFRKNITVFGPGSIDFISATHVYGDYTKHHYQESGGSFKLMYISGSTVTVVNSND